MNQTARILQLAPHGSTPDEAGQAVQPAAMPEADAARYIGMSVAFLRQSRMRGVPMGLARRTPGPPFVKIGRAVRYLRADLDAWLRQHRHGAQ